MAVLNDVRIRYKDSGGTHTEIPLDHCQRRLHKFDYDKVKIWSPSSAYGNIPLKTSEFHNSIPHIFLEQHSGSHSVTGVSTSNNEFVVSGDVTSDATLGSTVDVSGSTGNDGTYIVDSASYDGVADETTLGVAENVSDGTADGTLTIWKAQFRGYTENKGVIDSNGNVAWVLHGFGKRVGQFKLSSFSSGTNNTTVMSDVITQVNSTATEDYVLITNGSAVSLNNYSINDRVGRVFREMTRQIKWAFTFLPEKDSNGDWKVVYEEVGFGGTVDTIDTDPSSVDYVASAKLKAWRSEDISSVVNDVTVFTNNSSVKGTASDATSQSDYGVRSDNRRVSYDVNQSTADNIASEFLQPDGVEGGKIKLSQYRDYVVNDSFQVEDSFRSISGSFTCVQQINYYPELSTLLVLDYESEGEEAAAEQVDTVRQERNRVFDSTSTDVGNQSVSADTENVTDSYDAHNAAAGEHDVGGQSFSETSDANQLRTVLVNSKSKNNPFTGGGTANGILTAEVPGNNITGGIDFVYITVDCFAYNLSSSGYVTVRIYNDSAGTSIASETFTIGSNSDLFVETNPDISINASPGDIIRLDITQNGASADIEGSMTITCQQNHTHDITVNQPSQTNGAQAESDGSTNNTNPSDATANDTTSLSASGSTGTKNVNISSENKEDR